MSFEASQQKKKGNAGTNESQDTEASPDHSQISLCKQGAGNTGSSQSAHLEDQGKQRHNAGKHFSRGGFG